MDDYYSSRFLRWVLATLGGWVLGVVLIVVLAEVVRIGQEFALGVGMGLGVGFMQWRVARRWFGANSQWMWSTVVGLGLPFALSDVFGRWVTGSDANRLLTHVAVGSLLVGFWQYRLLQRRFRSASVWILACMGGWVVAVGLLGALVNGYGGGPTRAWLNMGILALGGVVVGITTGGTLVWLFRQQSPNDPRSPVAENSASLGRPLVR